MSHNPNAVAWFDIPATDLQRASKFYSTILDKQMIPADMGPDFLMHMFPYAQGQGVGGALVQSADRTPTPDGSVVYLDAEPDLQEVLDRVEAAGGQVLQPKMDIGGNMGHMAFILDTEGNKVGLFSQN